MREVDASWKRAIEVVDLLSACERENNRKLNKLEDCLFDTKAYIEEIAEIIKIQKERSEQRTATDIDCTVDDIECNTDELEGCLDNAFSQINNLKDNLNILKNPEVYSKGE
jgi:hypothetical protein